MLRILATGRVAVTCSLAVLAATGATAAQAQVDSPVPTHTSVKDPRNDVSKDLARIRPRAGDLDIRRVSARLSDGTVRVTLKVADLKRKHLAEQVNDGWHSIPSDVSAFLYFGKNLRWQITFGVDNGYGVATPSTDAMLLSDESTELDDPASGCLAEDGYTNRMAQEADYVRDTVAFTIPVDCLPPQYARARVNGMTGWDNPGGVAMWDDFSNHGYGEPDTRSTPFEFR